MLKYNPKILQIQKKSETNERFLKELIQGTYAFGQNYLHGGLRFGISRRWNSWYPSYFNVKGGCYVFMPGDMDPNNDDNKENSEKGVIVIDPGFKFIEILRETHQVEPQDVSTVIITHFHPDHMIGLLEYATIMKTSKQHCNIYLNETTFQTFRSLQSKYITIKELVNGQIQEIMRYQTISDEFVVVRVKAIGVHHEEIGNRHKSIGLIFDIIRSKSKDILHDTIQRYRIGILGDTDGNIQYIPTYIENFKTVDVLILHLGTFSNEQLGSGGKHLYIEGVKRILGQIGKEFEKAPINGDMKKIAVLSEFGLELASDNSLYKNLQPYIESHLWRLPIIFTSLYLKEQKTGKVITSENGDGSRFFARATLGIIERLYNPSESMISMYHHNMTTKEKDELIVTFGFQVLAFFSEGLHNKIIDLSKKLLKKIKKEKREKLIDSWPIKYYNSFLIKELTNEPYFVPIKLHYSDLIKKANFILDKLPYNHLIKSCDVIIDLIDENLWNPTRAFFYSDILVYVSNYAKSRNINKYRWTFGKGPGISDLNLFWTTCLIGVYFLRKSLEESSESKSIKSTKQNQNALIQIGDFFKKDAEPWANLLIGDIGCTFGLDPMSTSEKKECQKGIWLKSHEGDWISPYTAISFYDDENNQICYKTPKSKNQKDKNV